MPTDQQPTETARPRRLLTIHQQLLFALLSVNALVMFLIGAIFYSEQKAALLGDLDERLTAIAVMARAMLPPDYHDRITGPDSVPDAEFQKIVERNNQLCESLGIEYLWSLLLADGKTVFTSSTSPDKVAANRKHAAFFELHSNPELYTNTFATMRATYKGNVDKWGDIRVALIPFRDAQGRKYLFGSSVSVTEVESHLREVVARAVAVGVVGFLFSTAVGVWAARRVTRPISRLTDTIRAIAAGRTDLKAEETGSVEIFLLARHFNLMNRFLQGRITDLEVSRSRLVTRHDTELRHAAGSLQMSEQRYRSLLNFAVDGILVGMPDGTIVEANERICELFGLSRVEIVGRRITEMPFTPESLKDNPFRFDLLIKGERVVTERTIRHKDGSEIIVEMISKTMPDGTLQSIYRDITERRRSDKLLQESEERYRKLFEMESDAILLIDCESFRFIDANLSVETFYGYTRDEILSMGPLDITAEPERSQSIIFENLKEKNSHLRVSSIWHKKKDGTVFPVEIAGRYYSIKGHMVLLVAVRDVTERKKAQELLESWNASLERRVAERTAEVEKYAHQLQALAGRLVRAEEDERQRITDVLHEDLQQILVAARMTLGVVHQAVKTSAVAKTVGSVDSMLAQSIHLARSLVQDIAVPALHEGEIAFAVDWLRQQMQDKFNLEVDVQVEPGVRLVSENVYLCLYRAIQELLFNVVKHAQVGRVELAVRSADGGDGLQVVVRDHGCGFEMETLLHAEKINKGFGLFSIRERLEGLGGHMEIQSKPGCGTTVILTAPFRG